MIVATITEKQKRILDYFRLHPSLRLHLYDLARHFEIEKDMREVNNMAQELENLTVAGYLRKFSGNPPHYRSDEIKFPHRYSRVLYLLLRNATEPLTAWQITCRVARVTRSRARHPLTRLTVYTILRLYIGMGWVMSSSVGRGVTRYEWVNRRRS